MSSSEHNKKKGLVDKSIIWFDTLKKREQKLLFIGVPITIMVVAFLLVVEPQIKSAIKIDKRTHSLEKQKTLSLESIQELTQQSQKDPNSEIRSQIKSLEIQLAKLNAQFDVELSQLVSPQAMPVLLEQIFSKAEGLELVNMRSIAPQALFDNEQKGIEKQIYRHGIEIAFSGEFFATRDFLKQAENLGWKLYWQDLHFEVEKYPLAATRLTVFTLSSSEAFIGVY